ncbi:hypothetical protein NQ314_002164 [Rhamnusium bicolor]|uniref:Uncharacterized protein n=1 Tax=Rhamnusium bicolor TaxID=1586634 RepID=A0AAV8ZT87_9CUCU|nr:hypothetical protein NQ314_002164 [Rhamnusium bicolor]
MTANQAIVTSIKVSKIIDDDKNTSLHHSAALGREEDVKKDLETEPKIDVENYLGWTPLMMACKNGHLNIVKLLLEHRADATKKNKFGITPLMFASAMENCPAFTLLLSKGADTSIRNCLGFTAHQITEDRNTMKEDVKQKKVNQQPKPALINSPQKSLTLTKCSDQEPPATLTKCHQEPPTTLTNCHNQEPPITLTNCPHQEPPITIIKCPHQEPPSILTNSPHLQPHQHFQPQQIPYIVISPHQSFYQLPQNQIINPHLRKSSNTMTPSPNYFFATPNVTPITPLNFLPQPQMFFPPEFSPNQIFSPNAIQHIYGNPNDFLNARMNQNMCMSPMMSFPSPCV